VGADGARGLSRRTLGLGSVQESVGLGGSIEGDLPDRLVLSFPDLGDAYCWIFPRPEGCSVGIAYDAERVSHGAAAAALERFLDRHLEGGARRRWRGHAAPGEDGAQVDRGRQEPALPGAARGRARGVHRYRYPIPLHGSRMRDQVARAAASRILLVGDAAGVADPLTREGIRYAILSGDCAARSLLASRPERYAERLECELAPELERARRAARLFYDDPIAQWMVPLARVHPGIRAVLGDLLTCRQPYAGLRRRLLRAAVGRYACEASEPELESLSTVR
jgi:flavin-dependent dehydrogenase